MTTPEEFINEIENQGLLFEVGQLILQKNPHRTITYTQSQIRTDLFLIGYTVPKVNAMAHYRTYCGGSYQEVQSIFAETPLHQKTNEFETLEINGQINEYDNHWIAMAKERWEKAGFIVSVEKTILSTETVSEEQYLFEAPG